MHEAPIIAACGLPAVHFAAYLTFKSVAGAGDMIAGDPVSKAMDCGRSNVFVNVANETHYFVKASMMTARGTATIAIQARDKSKTGARVLRRAYKV
jgi:hypothetical protein